ncbi:sulfate/molybdate ABC transporter ATP-binding protein [Auraticoccus monumenti]|uniref:Molybdate transport system ATP-binding protein n=1 Tax=Auraticoccus monumenti TaxID=675864 RepID=A0A1G6X1E3_9ACTN|nr:ABC transporter ATP-binding protein [Auraticoccus monumenti]SDD72020.1 molybdate transport system ATP-binding protein [Auraticoccus monumenti]
MTEGEPAVPGRGLEAHLVLRRGRFDLDLALALPPGRVTALLGPNGAGKSTVLRALAGLAPLDGGRIVLDGEVLDDAAAGRLVPAERRDVGMVFQDYLLFPHLGLLDNVAFGLRARGVRRREADARAAAWLARVGLADLARVKPGRVSGGQAQRAALARALVGDPGLLLLDEPLAALDAGTRLGIRSDLRRHLAGYRGCTVLVTHDPLDAMVLADHLVVVEDGRLVQQGPPVEVARAPRTGYVATLVGLNLYRGRAVGGVVELADGGTLVTSQQVPGSCFAAFPPSAVSLHRRRPEGSARNVWPGTVAGLEAHPDGVRVRLDARPPVLADVTTAAVAELGLDPGQEVWASVKATEVRCYPA